MRSSSSGTEAGGSGRGIRPKPLLTAVCRRRSVRSGRTAPGQGGPRVLGWALASPTVSLPEAPARDLGPSGLETYFHRQSQSCSLRTGGFQECSSLPPF